VRDRRSVVVEGGDAIADIHGDGALAVVFMEANRIAVIDGDAA
jgi:hypothetical protein